MPSGGGDKLGDAATWRYYWRPSDVKRLVAHLAANPSPSPSPSPNPSPTPSPNPSPNPNQVAHLAANPSPNPSPSSNSNSNPSPSPSPNPIPNPNPNPNPNQVAHLAGRHPAEAALKRELQLRLPWWEAAQAYAEGQGGDAEGGAEGAEATIGIADATPMEVDAAGGAAGEGLREVSVAEGLLMLVMRQRQASSLREWWPAFLAVHAECRRVHPVVEAVLQEAVYIDW